MSLSHISQIYFCCRYSAQLVTQLGVVNSPDEEIIAPQKLSQDISYDIIIHNLPDFIRSRGNGQTKGLTREEFHDRYGEKLSYSLEASDEEKEIIMREVIHLFYDIEEVYHMSGLLSIPASIGRDERAILGSANFDRNNGEAMEELLNEVRDEEESTDDEEIELINATTSTSVRSSISVGDREVSLKDLRVICKLGDSYQILTDGGSITDQTECKLLSNITSSSFTSFISTFIYIGSIRKSIIDDFSTMITLYVQGFASEIDDGTLKSKSNFKSQNNSRRNLKSHVSKDDIESVPNGDSYWQTYAWFNLKSHPVEDYMNWCEDCFMKLIIYLDLTNENPDDMTPMPLRSPNQNVIFRTILEGLNTNDIRMAAASCELNKLFARKLGLRDQVRSIVSFLMILASNSYKISMRNDVRIVEWTLFPLSRYSQSQFLTNINYQQLYSVLKVLILFTV